MTINRTHRRGFTIVEMLVVIGVIAALAAILLPALGGAQRRAKKVEESNRIRQIGTAWMVYANNNNDAALPGYLDETVQNMWRVAYRFPDDSLIDPVDARPWVYRLATYFDFNHDMLHGYLDETEVSAVAMTSSPPTGFTPQQITALEDEIEEIALHPGFGYNAFHVGGWWTYDAAENRAVMTYASTQVVDSAGNPGAGVSVVSRSPSTIRQSDGLILFATTGQFPAGTVREVDDYHLGSHYALAPWQPNGSPDGLAVWQSGSSPSYVELFVNDAPVPIGRYTGSATVLFADNHTGPSLPGSLDDMRLWIDRADKPNFKYFD